MITPPELSLDAPVTDARQLFRFLILNKPKKANISPSL